LDKNSYTNSKTAGLDSMLYKLIIPQLVSNWDFKGRNLSKSWSEENHSQIDSLINMIETELSLIRIRLNEEKIVYII
jgi:hypothetical protein